MSDLSKKLVSTQACDIVPKMLFIENEGALFRGPARGVPLEVWSRLENKFIPYRFAGQPKPIDWGHLIDEAQAIQLMAA